MNSELLKQLKVLKPVLKEKFRIEKLAVFGSVARGEESTTSDIDLAVIEMKEKNYFTLIEAMAFLKERLHRDVDMGFFDAVRPFIKKRIEKDFIYV